MGEQCLEVGGRDDGAFTTPRTRPAHVRKLHMACPGQSQRASTVLLALVAGLLGRP